MSMLSYWRVPDTEVLRRMPFFWGVPFFRDSLCRRPTCMLLVKLRKEGISLDSGLDIITPVTTIITTCVICCRESALIFTFHCFHCFQCLLGGATFPACNDVYIYIPRKSKDQTLPIGSRESFTWIILNTILCLVLDVQGIYIYIYVCLSQLTISRHQTVTPPKIFVGSGALDVVK